jgi:hypothetical protein
MTKQNLTIKDFLQKNSTCLAALLCTAFLIGLAISKGVILANLGGFAAIFIAIDCLIIGTGILVWRYQNQGLACYKKDKVQGIHIGF